MATVVAEDSAEVVEVATAVAEAEDSAVDVVDSAETVVVAVDSATVEDAADSGKHRFFYLYFVRSILFCYCFSIFFSLVVLPVVETVEVADLLVEDAVAVEEPAEE